MHPAVPGRGQPLPWGEVQPGLPRGDGRTENPSGEAELPVFPRNALLGLFENIACLCVLPRGWARGLQSSFILSLSSACPAMYCLCDLGQVTNVSSQSFWGTPSGMHTETQGGLNKTM